MRTSTSPVVAPTHAMAETLATFYAFATVAGALTALSGPLHGVHLVIVLGLLAIGLVSAGGMALGARRLPRWSVGVLVGLGNLLVAAAVLDAPDPRMAVVCSFLLAFTAVDSCYFYDLRTAMAFLGTGIVLATAALTVRSDVSLPTALALDIILIAITVVTRTLVLRASGASVDALTGLANRRAFDDALRAALAPTAVLSVALLDVDHFKQINDSQGHDSGDRVLCRVADLRRSLPVGALLARHGGDEFALLLPGLDGPRALVEVHRLAAALPAVALSCGVARYVPGETAAQVMRRADRALYAVKTAGRGHARLDPGPDPDPARKGEPGSTLHSAVPISMP